MANLRYILIPASVSVSVNQARWSFLHCFVHVIDRHPSFNQTGTGVRAAARVMALVTDNQGRFLKKEGDVITLDQADWQMVQAAFEEPAAGYIPGPLTDDAGVPINVPARSFVTYIEAVSDEATKNHPAPTAVPLGGIAENGVAVPVPAPAPALPAAEPPS